MKNIPNTSFSFNRILQTINSSKKNLAVFLILLASSLMILPAQVPIQLAHVPDTIFPLATEGLTLGDIAWGDYNNDGKLDLVITGFGLGYSPVSTLFRNTGNEFQEDGTINLPNLGWSSVKWTDLNQDNALDLIIMGEDNLANAKTQIFYNDGSGSFIMVDDTSLTPTRIGDVETLDHDNDGNIDIIISGKIGGGIEARLYVKKESGSFIKSEIIPDFEKNAIASGDFDNDGDWDILISGEDESNQDRTEIYQNLGGVFEVFPNSSFEGIENSSVAWSDYNNDDFLDFIILGNNAPATIEQFTELYVNQSGSGFTQLGTNPFVQLKDGDIAWGDANHDGFSDLLLTGNANGTAEARLYINNQGTSFSNVVISDLEGAKNSSAAWGDFNNDDKLDLIVMGGEGATIRSLRLYENVSNIMPSKPNVPQNLQQEFLLGEVYLSWDSVFHDSVSQGGITYNLYVYDLTRNKFQLSPLADTITGYRKVPEMGNVNTNTSWTLKKLPPGQYIWGVQAIDGKFTGSFFARGDTFEVSYPFEDVTDQVLPDVIPVDLGDISWGDYNNDGFLDFVSSGQKEVGFITHVYQSDSGKQFNILPISPPIRGLDQGSTSWGDFDGDNDLDLLLTGGASSMVYTLIFRNNWNGTPPIFKEEYSASLQGIVQGDAHWKDWDNDGDLDFFITGLTITANGQRDTSQLYFNKENEGLGFIADSTQITQELYKSRFSWTDYDNDGDWDFLMVGEKNDPGNPKKSVFYKHIDNHQFDYDPIISESIPQVNRAEIAWGDYDNDGYDDLAIVGRNMDEIFEIYRNTDASPNRQFTKVFELPDIGVEYGSVDWGDYDNDGDRDILLTGRTLNGQIHTTVLFIIQNHGNGSFEVFNLNFLDGVTFGKAIWGDYDRDNRLDILLTGKNECDERITKIYKNKLPSSNQIPESPILLYPQINGDTVTLRWEEGSDSDIPSTGNAGLSYNLFLQKAGEDSYIISPMSDIQTGIRRTMDQGNVGHNLQRTIDDLEEGKYFWSVQTIDQALAGSPFAKVDSFVLPEPPKIPFSEVSLSFEGFSQGDVKFVDYNNDGWLDVIMQGLNEFDLSDTRIYKNDSGTFVPSGIPIRKLFNGGIALGDFNNDTWIDVAINGREKNSDQPFSGIYKNTSGNLFSLENTFVEHSAEGNPFWGDINQDGLLDLGFSGNGENGEISLFYLNKGNDPFGPDSIKFPDDYYDCSFVLGDLNNDEYLDIFITGGDGDALTDIFYGNTEVSFDRRDEDNLGVLMGLFESPSVDLGDFDRNGLLDILLSGEDSEGGCHTLIYKNIGGGRFEKIEGQLADVCQGMALWGDANNDGNLDVVVSGTDTSGNPLTYLYLGDGNGNFEVQRHLSFPNLAHSQVAWGDYDNDGDLDVLLSGIENGLAITKLYQNQLDTPNQVPAPPSNLNAVVTDKEVYFSWSAPNDDTTPSDALTYNLFVGTSPDSVDIISPMAELNTGFRRIVQRGLVQTNFWTLKDLEPGTYYWSVQAVDHSFTGSPFTEVDTFVIAKEVPAPAFVSIEGPDCIHLGTETGITIQAKVEDSVAVAEMILHYRPLSDTVWIQVSQEISAFNYSFEVLETAFRDAVLSSKRDNIGIEYYFEAKNENQKSALSNSGFVYICYDDLGLEFPTIIGGKKKENYIMISFPLEPDDPTLDQILDPILGKPNRKNWRLFHTHNTGQEGKTELWEYCINNSDFITAERGKGYWLLSKDDATIFTGPGATTLPGDAPFSIQLKPGWNHIGNPYNFNLLWEDVVAFNGLTIGDLQLNIFDRGYVSSNRIDRFMGVLVHADTDVTIQFPTYKNPSAQTERRAKIYFYDPSHFFRNDAWFLPLSLINGEDSLELGGIGVHPDAKMSKDQYDRITPPRFFDYREINFYHPEYFSPRFMVDVIPVRKNYVWSFQIEGNLSSRLQTISWPVPEVEIPGYHLMLLDVEEQKVINMMGEQNYDFLMEEDSYRFQVFYGDESYLKEAVQPQRIHVGKVYPNPTKRILKIPISLPEQNEDYSVKIVLTDVSGKQILLTNEEKMTSGFRELSVDLAEYLEHRLTSEIYVCQITVSAKDQFEVFVQKFLVE